MEKHCERQHGIVPPGGRGHFMGASVSPTIDLPSITSPFQQVRTYPAPMKTVPKTDLSSSIDPIHNSEAQPRVFHSGTRLVVTIS